MAIRIQGTIVVDDGRAISNITNVSAVDATFNGTGAVKVPVGTTAQQPVSAVLGMIRFNTTKSLMEVFDGLVWKSIGPSDAKQYFLANY
jgi:hypothetical protein